MISEKLHLKREETFTKQMVLHEAGDHNKSATPGSPGLPKTAPTR